MKYKKILSGMFLNRPNRFIANVDIDGKLETVHVKNTGRCKELLKKGCKIYLSESDNPLRKTKYDLVAVEKICENGDKILINMDSQAPNDAVWEWLKGGLFSRDAIVRREVKYKDSRFDFYIEDQGKRAFLEVKGVTLEENGTALFPDAPTERGIKHINELIDALSEGYEAYIIFVIQMKKINCFKPNCKTHPQFGEALKKAKTAGVKILAFDCKISPDEMIIENPINVII
jgi:sugar fermentation stimulation protein A